MHFALRMTKKGIAQVRYESVGQLFREQSEWDIFFRFQKGNSNKLILQSLPITVNADIYSFNHKSIQEFYIAKYIYENITKYQSLNKLHILKIAVKLLQEYVDGDAKAKREEIHGEAMKNNENAIKISHQADLILGKNTGVIAELASDGMSKKDQAFLDLLQHNRTLLSETSKL